MPCPGKSKSRHGRLALLPLSSCATHTGHAQSFHVAPNDDRAGTLVVASDGAQTTPRPSRVDGWTVRAAPPRHVAAAALATPGRDAADPRVHPSTMCPIPASGRFHRTPTREPHARAPRPGPLAPRSTRRGCRHRRAHSMPCPGRSKSRHGRLALFPHSSCAAHTCSRVGLDGSSVDPGRARCCLSAIWSDNCVRGVGAYVGRASRTTAIAATRKSG